MDNFTHSLTGWALGQTGLKRKSRKGLAALILGANMPDIDVFFGWAPWAPLAMHRGFTHGLVGGVLVMPPMLAGLLWLLDRWQVSRGARFRSGLSMRFGWLVALSYIGAITHPLLDWQNTYAVQMFSPFSERWYHNDALFIIDAFLWSLIPFAIWLSRRRERRAGDWRKPAIAALAIAVVYISGNALLSAKAKRDLLASGARPDAVFASEPPVLFWQREMIWRQDHVIRYADWSLAHGIGPVELAIPDNMADPVVRVARRDLAIRRFLRWSIVPFAQVRREGCTATVTFGDGRFGRGLSRGRLARQTTVPLCR